MTIQCDHVIKVRRPDMVVNEKENNKTTRGSLSLYSWYALDRGQIPNMAVTGPNR